MIQLVSDQEIVRSANLSNNYEQFITTFNSIEGCLSDLKYLIEKILELIFTINNENIENFIFKYLNYKYKQYNLIINPVLIKLLKSPKYEKFLSSERSNFYNLLNNVKDVETITQLLSRRGKYYLINYLKSAVQTNKLYQSKSDLVLNHLNVSMIKSACRQVSITKIHHFKMLNNSLLKHNEFENFNFFFILDWDSKQYVKYFPTLIKYSYLFADKIKVGTLFFDATTKLFWYEDKIKNTRYLGKLLLKLLPTLKSFQFYKFIMLKIHLLTNRQLEEHKEEFAEIAKRYLAQELFYSYETTHLERNFLKVYDQNYHRTRAKTRIRRYT